MVVAVGQQVDAAADQIVLDGADGAFVAGDDAAGEDHGVALAEFDAGVGVHGDAGERAAGFALAAGDEHQQAVVVDVGDVVFAEEGGDALEIAAFTGGAVEVAQGAADDGDRAAGGAGGHGDGFDAGDVAGKAGHRDAAAQGGDQVGQAAADVALGAGGAFDHGVGGVADHGQHAFVAQGAQGGFVGGGADEGFGVEFPVAGVQDQAGLGADGERLRFRDGMGHADELQVEGGEAEAGAGLDDGDLDVLKQAGFAELAAQDGGGEGGGVDRAAQLRPEPGDGADVVLVGVGDDQADQLVAAFGDVCGVGDHDVDFGVFRAAEAHAAIDGEPLAAAAVEVEVHADFARSAEGQKGQVSVCGVHANLSGQEVKQVSPPGWRARVRDRQKPTMNVVGRRWRAFSRFPPAGVVPGLIWGQDCALPTGEGLPG